MILHVEYEWQSGEDLDTVLFQIVNPDFCSSGFMVRTFVRDMQWEINDLERVRQLIGEIEGHPKLRGIARAWVMD